MQKILLSCLFLLLIIQSCGLDNFVEEEENIPFMNTSPASLELLGEKDHLLVIDFNQILDLSTPLSLKIKQNPTKGKITFIEKSSFLIYEPNKPSTSGIDSFTYEITYSNGQVVEAEVSIQLYDENTELGLDSCKVKAAYDYIETPINTPFTTKILDNDIFCDGTIDVLSAVINITTEHGELILDNGEVIYIPDNDFVGYDQFIYSVCTDNGNCASAVGEISVTEPIPCLFELTDDKYDIELTNQVLDSSVWQWDVFRNDSLCTDQVDWNTFKISKDPLHGIALLDSLDGGEKTISFSPDYDFEGNDMFTYEVCDTNGVCYSANVQVTITNNINFSVTLNDDLIFYKSQTDNKLAVLLNDLVDENIVNWTTFDIINQSQNGIAEIEQNSEGKYIISYTPESDFSGVDKLSYGLCSFSGECFEAEVKLIVQPDDFICPTITPVAKNDTIVFHNGQNENNSLEIAVLDNDNFCFAKIDWSSFEVITSPQYGSVEVNIGESISYNFLNGFNYTNITQDEFRYRWVQNGETFEATVVIQLEESIYTCFEINTVDSLSNGEDFDIHAIISARIEGDQLYTTIRYVGGCDFDLNTHDLVVADQYSNQGIITYDMKYLFKDKGSCSFIVHDTRCFDLSIFKTNPIGGSVIIKLKDYKELIYNY